LLADVIVVPAAIIKLRVSSPAYPSFGSGIIGEASLLLWRRWKR
jgi:hypothetical protein